MILNEKDLRLMILVLAHYRGHVAIFSNLCTDQIWMAIWEKNLKG